MILYYVRHGDPIYDPDSLTELGQKQALALSKRFAKYGLDEIYSSSSVRAMQTAQPTAKLLGKDITVFDWAHENNAWVKMSVQKENRRIWGFQDKETISKFNSFDVFNMGKNWYNHPYFVDTEFKAFTCSINEKVDEFLFSLGYAHDRENNVYKAVKRNSKKIALFAHQGIGMSILSSILDIPYPLFSTHFDLSHSSVTAIYFDEKSEYVVPKVLQLANDSHLYKEEVNCKYNNMYEV
ncbi:MAG: histidine phosphatase family protein [Clostridiales bacterium]|nr:histidine phosphatase family protein [Clostridiales bacterium]